MREVWGHLCYCFRLLLLYTVADDATVDYQHKIRLNWQHTTTTFMYMKMHIYKHIHAPAHVSFFYMYSMSTINVCICHIPLWTAWWRHQSNGNFSVLLALCAGIHRSPVNSPLKGLWRGALMFSLICAWINGWVNNREAGELRRHRDHYDFTVMSWDFQGSRGSWAPLTNMGYLYSQHGFHPRLYRTCDNLSMLGLKLAHACKRGPMLKSVSWAKIYITINMSNFNRLRPELPPINTQ